LAELLRELPAFPGNSLFVMTSIISYQDSGLWSRLASFCGQESASPKVAEAVAHILKDIRARGDAAVLDHTLRIDKVQLSAGPVGASLRAGDPFAAPLPMRIPGDELKAAADALDADTRAAIEDAIASVRAFHEKGLPRSWSGQNVHGATVGERFYPLERVGLYIPGGNVPLVSTVVMTATLAKLAGVPSICACTPPGREGRVSQGLLAAFHLCGVSEVYRVGGPMAIGAMAYGTQTVEPVAKVFGPGNAYVAEAKRQVLGVVGIDILAGPSEVTIVADASANPAWIAADLIAQAEHGSGAEKVSLITIAAPGLPERVDAEIERQLPGRTHRAAIERVLRGGGYLVVTCDTPSDAAKVANYMAPEHLEIQTDPALFDAFLRDIRTAGAIFLGHETPTVLGDFAAGPNHTLPTLRSGRFYSGLQITDFFRRSSVTRYEHAALEKAAHIVRAFARLEQLDGHGESLEQRLKALG